MIPCPDPGARFSLLLLGILPLLPVPGDRPEGTPDAADPVGLAQQRVLEEESLGFARAWVDGDFSSLESRLAPEGIRLHLEGELYPVLDPGRAVRALRNLAARYGGGDLALRRISLSPGGDPGGFADLEWQTRVAGTGETVSFTVFLAYVQREGTWRVTEIRVLP
jgi:hypothetical protein